MLKLKKFLANIPRQVFLYYNKRDLLNVVISCYEQVKEFARVMQEFINNVNNGVYNKPVTNIITKKGNTERKYIVHRVISWRAKKGSLYYFNGYPKIQGFIKKKNPDALEPTMPWSFPLIYDGINLYNPAPVLIEIIKDFDFTKDELFTGYTFERANSFPKDNNIYEKVKDYIKITRYDSRGKRLNGSCHSPFFKIVDNKVICTRQLSLPDKFSLNDASSVNDIRNNILKEDYHTIYFNIKSERRGTRCIYKRDSNNNNIMLNNDKPIIAGHMHSKKYRLSRTLRHAGKILVYTYHIKGEYKHLMSKDYYIRLKTIHNGGKDNIYNAKYIHTKKV